MCVRVCVHAHVHVCLYHSILIMHFPFAYVYTYIQCIRSSQQFLNVVMCAYVRITSDIKLKCLIYSRTCIIRHPWGVKNAAGLVGCWIIEASLYGEIGGWCQRILAGLGIDRRNLPFPSVSSICGLGERCWIGQVPLYT